MPGHPNIGIVATPSFCVFGDVGANSVKADTTTTKAAAAPKAIDDKKKGKKAKKAGNDKKAPASAPADTPTAPVDPALMAKYERILSVGEECQVRKRGTGTRHL